MLTSVVSPKTTVNRPLLTGTITAADGSLPATLAPSLLQEVAKEMLGAGGATVTAGGPDMLYRLPKASIIVLRGRLSK